MDTRYFSLAMGLAVVGLVLFLGVRRAGREDRLPLLPNPTGKERSRVQLYMAIGAVAVLTLTGALGVWGIMSD